MNYSPSKPTLGVTVVIPTYNRVDTLKRAISSVTQQTTVPFEIIVVDDGSTDHSRARLSPLFPEVQWISQENQGVSHARNQGIKKAQGEWIAFLDSDDAWHPEKLEIQFKLLQEKPSLSFCHTDEQWIRNGKKVNPPAYLEKSNRKIFEKSLERCIICPSSVLVRKSTLESVGLFNETLPVCEDYDLWLRLIRKYSIAHIPEKLVTKYGGHEDQLSSRYWGMDRFRVISLENLLSTDSLCHEQKNLTLQILVQKLDRLTQSFKKHEKYEEANLYKAKSIKYSKHLQSLSIST